MLLGIFNARVAARPDIDDDLGSFLKALRLPVARAGADRSFRGLGRHLLQLCLLAGLVLLIGRTVGECSCSHLLPTSSWWVLTRPLLLVVDLLPDAFQSQVDVSRQDSDHFPLLTVIRRQPSAYPSTASISNDGHPLARAQPGLQLL